MGHKFTTHKTFTSDTQKNVIEIKEWVHFFSPVLQTDETD